MLAATAVLVVTVHVVAFWSMERGLFAVTDLRAQDLRVVEIAITTSTLRTMAPVPIVGRNTWATVVSTAELSRELPPEFGNAYSIFSRR